MIFKEVSAILITVDISLSFSMNIHLNDRDISQMPTRLRNDFLDWLPQRLKDSDMEFSNQQSIQTSPVTIRPEQLKLNLNSIIDENGKHSNVTNVTLTQLFDAGITRKGMPVRIRLKREIAKRLQCNYVNGLDISPKGTIVYKSEEFDKPSPLAVKVHGGGAANGWYYVEIKNNGEWISLEELRQNWRKING